MSENVYLFNPDHDLALASDSDHYDAPQSAVVFAQDFAFLPIWYSKPNSFIYHTNPDFSWFLKMQQRFPKLQGTKILQQVPITSSIHPWGWNKTVHNKLSQLGCTAIPNDAELATIRELSHRKYSILATKELWDEYTDCAHTIQGVLLKENEIDAYIEKNPFCIFKAPWSGSGKGICRSLGGLTENLRNRVIRIAQKQGSILAEPLYDVVQNFAMEFYCDKGNTSFAGYSWFFTNDNGAYQGNLLASDSYIESLLNQWISTEHLIEIQTKLIAFFNKNYSSYTGYCGVDMFIHKKENKYYIHPCVEINVRMTMGLVARLFYDKFVCEGRTGTYSVDFYKDANELQASDKLLNSQKPLQLENGKVSKGYISLTPITANTHYRARIEIT